MPPLLPPHVPPELGVRGPSPVVSNVLRYRSIGSVRSSPLTTPIDLIRIKSCIHTHDRDPLNRKICVSIKILIACSLGNDLTEHQNPVPSKSDLPRYLLDVKYFTSVIDRRSAIFSCCNRLHRLSIRGYPPLSRSILEHNRTHQRFTPALPPVSHA